MSVHFSYFNKNNTLINGSYTNTGRNPVTQLYFGSPIDTLNPVGFTRFIFNLDLSSLQSKISSGTINTSKPMTHTLRMTNTSSFDTELLNTTMSDTSRRATSFDLFLFRITGQTWDEGVGYDFLDTTLAKTSSTGQLTLETLESDKSYSDRPSNWFKKTTLSGWTTPGIYNNVNSATGSGLNYSALTIVDTQHFELGNENVTFNMTNEINRILTGSTTGVTGYGIAYLPAFENISGLTENYSVGFFTRHTQTYYQPFLETTYDDLITDDRNLFVSNRTNHLYLYVYSNGDYRNLDNNPLVNIYDPNDDIVRGLSALTTTKITKGIYEVTIPPITGYTTPCEFSDVWSGLTIDGNSLTNITNYFILQSYTNFFEIGTESREPVEYGFDFYGIKQDEKILNTEIRKVGVIAKKAYTSQQILNKIQCYYRVFVREGQTEVQVQDWTEVNRTPNELYFMFDTTDKIPNEYFIDIKIQTSGQVDIYKRTLKFQIVNRK